MLARFYGFLLAAKCVYGQLSLIIQFLCLSSSVGPTNSQHQGNSLITQYRKHCLRFNTTTNADKLFWSPHDREQTEAKERRRRLRHQPERWHHTAWLPLSSSIYCTAQSDAHCVVRRTSARLTSFWKGILLDPCSYLCFAYFFSLSHNDTLAVSRSVTSSPFIDISYAIASLRGTSSRASTNNRVLSQYETLVACSYSVWLTSARLTNFWKCILVYCQTHVLTFVLHIFFFYSYKPPMWQRSTFWVPCWCSHPFHFCNFSCEFYWHTLRALRFVALVVDATTLVFCRVQWFLSTRMFIVFRSSLRRHNFNDSLLLNPSSSEPVSQPHLPHCLSTSQHAYLRTMFLKHCKTYEGMLIASEFDALVSVLETNPFRNATYRFVLIFLLNAFSKRNFLCSLGLCTSHKQVIVLVAEH